MGKSILFLEEIENVLGFSLVRVRGVGFCKKCVTRWHRIIMFVSYPCMSAISSDECLGTQGGGCALVILSIAFNGKIKPQK